MADGFDSCVCCYCCLKIPEFFFSALAFDNPNFDLIHTSHNNNKKKCLSSYPSTYPNNKIERPPSTKKKGGGIFKVKDRNETTKRDWDKHFCFDSALVTYWFSIKFNFFILCKSKRKKLMETFFFLSLSSH